MKMGYFENDQVSFIICWKFLLVGDFYLSISTMTFLSLDIDENGLLRKWSSIIYPPLKIFTYLIPEKNKIRIAVQIQFRRRFQSFKLMKFWVILAISDCVDEETYWVLKQSL